MIPILALLSLGLLRLDVVQSFATLPLMRLRHQPLSRRSLAFMASADAEWKLPNEFETLLNQCSIQSFMFLLKSLRDPQTILYVERFSEPSIQRPTTIAESSGASSDSRLLAYHGLGAINTTIFPTWQSYFEKLLDQPVEVHMIESQTAWAPDYELEINPPRLCSRILSVREQIAREWVGDLAVIANMGGLALELYWARLREDRGGDRPDPSRPSLRAKSNLLFLEFDPLMTDDYMPSPLRKGNFDLLCLASTQEAIHRLLNEMQFSGEQKATSSFLRDFYASRILSHFTGSKWYGMADDFLENLLNEPPRTVQVGGQGVFMVDPTSVAEVLLETRRNVALEWQSIARDVPNRHMDIKRKQLNLLMGKPKEETIDEPFQ